MITLALLAAVGATAAAARAHLRAPSYADTGYEDGTPYPLKLSPIGEGFFLRADAALAFLRMAAEARKAGVTLKINTAFRRMVEQVRLYEAYLNGAGALAARPGYSNHQNGIAVDIETGGGRNAAYLWLTQNASRFGFKRTVPSETWHWEYRPAEVMT